MLRLDSFVAPSLRVEEREMYGKCLVAGECVRAGTVVGVFGVRKSEVRGARTMHTVQLDATRHIESFDVIRFTAHADAPNARLRAFALVGDGGEENVVARPIAEAEEQSVRAEGLFLETLVDVEEGGLITFDYATSEEIIAAGFSDVATSRAVVGFRDLSREEKERRRPFLTPYLRALLNAQTAATES